LPLIRPCLRSHCHRAGAVAQATALTLGGLPDATGYASVCDPDTLDLSNDNRYALELCGSTKILNYSRQ
jgi:hypothetical protein